LGHSRKTEGWPNIPP